jgi:hypothetical protein
VEDRMRLIEEVTKTIELDVRVSSGTYEYFEAVFQTKDLDALLILLKNSFGEPLKPAGKTVGFSRNEKKILGLIGGIRREQTLYLKEETGGEYIYAALWPWQIDPSKITLKIGKGNYLKKE